MPPKKQYPNPYVRLEISWDGMEVTPSILDDVPREKSLVHGRYTKIGNVRLGYKGLFGTGAISQIGKKRVNFRFLSNEVKNVTGNDPRVDVFVRQRSSSERDDKSQKEQKKDKKSLISRLFS